jgi:sirohydrochlorin ferrochelatase
MQENTIPQVDPADTGVIVVDHGSRRGISNDMLLDVVAMFERVTGWPIVEPAHMELAEPSIATAFDQCVARGAKRVVVFPYFLLPGRHWSQDIPNLTAEAAARHPGVPYLVTAPIGVHDWMGNIMDQRIRHCLACASGDVQACEICTDRGACQFRAGMIEGRPSTHPNP